MNIEDYLEDKGIEVATDGKNVARGWIEINCPYCGDDPSTHLGINTDSYGFNCWRCGTKGNLIQLIQKLESCSTQVAEKIVAQLQKKVQIKTKTEPVTILDLPEGIVTGEIPELHRRYLLNRGFTNHHALSLQYNLMYCGEVGEYKLRILIPVYIDNRMVTYTSRDVTGIAHVKYKSCHNDKAIIPIKNCLYNIDRIRDSVVIVEGPFDAMRIGNGSVALFGKIITTQQLLLLYKYKPNNVFILLDRDAKKEAESISRTMIQFFNHVEVIHIENYKDPGELPASEVKHLRKELNLWK
jgi:DNA primase